MLHENSVRRQSARILTYNKYNQSMYFVLSEFCTDIVFELSDGTKMSKTIVDVNLPIYAEQLVELIFIDDTLIAFEDKQEQEFYYLSNNPGSTLGGLQISWMHIIVLTILLYYSVSILLPNYADFAALALLLPLAYRVYRAILDNYFEKKLDKLIIS